MNELNLRETDAQNTVLRGLIELLDRELYSHYPADEVFTLPLDDPSMNEVTFVVAMIGGQAVGCGAIRPLDGEHIELKRFYVDPAYRQMGIASRMLAYLEQKARLPQAAAGNRGQAAGSRCAVPETRICAD